MRVSRGLRRIGRVLAYVLVFMPLVIAVLVVSSPLILRHMVNTRIADIRARGEPITPADLAGPKIPDSQNGAEVYQKIFERLKEPQFSKDREILAEFLSSRKRAENPELWDDARDIVARYEWALPMMEEAVSRPKCRFPVDWNAPPLEIKFPHLKKIQYLSKLLATRAFIRAENGKMSEAVRSVELGLKLGDSLRDESYLVSQLVRLSTLGITCDSLREVLSHGRISDSEAEHVSDALGRIDLSSSLRLGLKGERAMWNLYLDQLRTDPGKLDDKTSTDTRPGAFWTTFVYANQLQYLKAMDKYIQFAGMPYREARTKLKSMDAPWPLFIADILLPSGQCDRWGTAEAKLAGSRIVLALTAYSQRFGLYPDSLEDLEKRVGWRLPEDPFSGKPFIYKRKDKGFIFYSIGPNLRDDGGLSEEEIERNHQLLPPPRPPRSDDYDIVWEMDH